MTKNLHLDLIGYFFGVLAFIAYFFMLFYMLTEESNTLLAENFAVYLSIQIVLLYFGLRGFNGGTTASSSIFPRFDWVELISKKTKTFMNRVFRNREKFYVVLYIGFLFLCFILFLKMASSINIKITDSKQFTAMFWIFESTLFLSYLSLLTFIIIKTTKRKKE